MIHFSSELHTLSFDPHLNSHTSCLMRNLGMLLTFMFFTLFETHTSAHGLLIALQLSPHLLTLTLIE